jgi:hypothetical protein
MTAEVAVINKMGVALAADSAVTAVKGQGTKIYNTANKLFRLSEINPVGIMIFGSSELMGIPWETIIKHYTKKLGDQQFNTLEEYADQFITSLDNGSPLFPPSEQERYVYTTIFEFFSMMMDAIQETVDEIISEEGEIDKSKYRNIVSSTISDFYDFLKSHEKISSIPENHNTDIINKYQEQIEEVKAETFKKLPVNITDRLDKKLTEICGELFIRKISAPRTSSGIVIAGFGEEDFFPSVISYLVEGVANNKLKYDQTQKIEANTRMTSAIVPFAQRDMVYTFVEGVNPIYTNFSEKYLRELFNNYPDIILDSLSELTEPQKNKLSKKLKKLGNSLVNDFSQSMGDYRRREFIDPIVNAVAVLPKEELAVLAESLVNLTALKQKMSMSYETVGGFIDVAVITKGDGFVWIKQKQYPK